MTDPRPVHSTQPDALSQSVENSFATELQVLQSIYLDDIAVQADDQHSTTDNSITVNILPATADRETDQHVKMVLRMDVSGAYPNEAPQVRVVSSRGLADHFAREVENRIQTLAGRLLGNAMLFDLIELARELLTAHNFPSGQRCPLCLYGFAPEDQLTRTSCFHHLHSRCLAEYAQFAQFESKKQSNGDPDNQQPNSADTSCCPVCRSPIDISGFKHPKEYPPPVLSLDAPADESDIIEEAKQEVEKFKDLFEKQQKQGGIIDLQQEMNRFFIRISEETEHL